MTGRFQSRPPPVEEFARLGSRAGSRSLCIAMAGIAITLDGLEEDLATQMETRYASYLADPPGPPGALRVEVLAAPVDYFVEPGFASRMEEYRVLTALDGPLFRAVSYRFASWIDLDRKIGQVALGSGTLDPAPRAMENFIRSCVAWLALTENGLFLHGASIVRDGRCFLFYGPTRAGKSTLAAMSTRGRVISDDLTLLLRRPDGLVAAGSPFRGTYTAGEPVVGTFPVAAFYRLRKDSRTEVRPDNGGCFADLLGNLPYVVDQMQQRPEIIDAVRARVAGLSFRYLHFQKDVDFWPAIDAESSHR
ncbi:MAG: hypothetical protein O7A63_12055 [Acidobacteria bacterium]|nr:hypothetical protein [Acidobacteriota bacterium]